MNPVLIRLNSDDDFGEQKTASTDATVPVPMFRIAAHKEVDGSGAGIWECTPGKFRRQVPQAEFSYIIEGEGSFTPDEGSVVRFCAGDSLYFSPNTQGEWHIKQTVRKAYFIVK